MSIEFSKFISTCFKKEFSMTDDNTRYCTVRQIADDPSFCFNLSMLRYYILHAHKNGLAKAIRRVGRKILIRRDLFIEWLEKQTNRHS